MSLPIRCRRGLALAGAALLALPFLVAGAVPAGAQTTVTTEQQLRDAVTANAATIVLGANITLTCDGVGNGPLAIDSNTTLRSSSSTEMRTLTVNGTCRIIEVSGGATLTIERLHLTGGRAPAGANGDDPGDPGTDGGHGGAILSDGTVTITDSRLSNNRAGDGGHGDDGTSAAGVVGGPGGAGGDGGNGGAIYTTGAVTVTRSTFDDNRAGSGGDGGAGGLGGNGAPAGAGAAGNNGFAGGGGGSGGNGGNGGAIAAGGTVTIARSTLTVNLAGTGGDGGNGGAGGAGSAADVGSGEDGGNGGAAGDGADGGDAGSGGAVSAGSINVTTSTLHANALGAPGEGGSEGTRGPLGGGDDPGGTDGDLGTEGDPGDDGTHGTGGATSSTGNVSFTSATVTANTATDAGAARSIRTGGSLSLNHTYVGGTGDGTDCSAQSFGAVTSSMAGDNSCTGATTQANPDLGSLANNGGLTQTRLPAAASPLVNAGAATCPETTDQRGVTRKQGTLCDIGAVELRGALTATVVGVASEATAPVGDNVTVTFTVTIASTATGVLSQDELSPTITGCTTTPVRSGSPAPYVANDVITWTCTVTSATVTSLNVTYAATVATGEGSTLPLNATVPVQFQAATTTTTADATTTTTTPVVVGDGGVAGAGGGALPRTGLSILFTLVAGAALVFGGSSMSKVAKARAEQSPRWNVKYGVPYPAGTHKQRTRDDQI